MNVFPKKIMLLGSGELGKEVVIAAKRIGCHVIACDRYKEAPAMQVADISEVLDMSNKLELKEVDINGNAKMLALNMVKGDINKMNTFEFKKMFMADKMYTVIKDLDSWLNNSFNSLNAYASL